MSDNINRINGKDSIVWTGETPWHRLGQKLPQAFTAEEALAHGGLDYTVEKVALQTVDGTPVPDRFGLRRTDTGDILGIGAGRYRPLQNREAFSFFDGLFGTGQARFEVAGVLGKGETAWLLARLNGEFDVVKGDPVNQFALLSNGFDNNPVRAKFTPIRVVCANTLSAALGRGSAEQEVRVAHVGDVPGKLALAGKLLKAAGIYFQDVGELFRGFGRVQMKQAALRSYFTQVLTRGEKTAEDFEELATQTRNRVEEMERIHDTGRGTDIRGVRGTLWGAYNAVTEFVDHVKTGDNLAYAMEGKGARIKQRAFDYAKELVEAAN